jgi:4-oxalocrotonate tautomerase
MPLVRIDLRRGKSAEYRAAISQGVYDAMAAVLKVPAKDRFQVITEHDPDALIYDPRYLGIERSEDVIFIEIILNQGRTLEQKKAFYRVVADGLAKKPGVKQEDILIVLVEVAKENWSFGNGVAQYAT